MKNILLIGVGGTGSRAVDIFFQKYNELGKQNDNKVTALVFDTDAGDVKNITSATAITMADSASVGTICDRIGKEYLREWFPCDDPAIRAQEMLRGASQWRKKSYLAFLNLMNKPLSKATFIGALERMVADPKASCEVYIISSVAGGTGSGSFIPIALYTKRYLRKNLGKDPIINAMIALPEIYADSQTPENRVKIFANAYAILRELNAINLVARNYNEGRTAQKKAPIKFRIGHPNEPNVGVLFDASDRQFWTPEAAPFSQVFLLDRIPCLNSVIAHDIVLANSLYTILCTDIGAQFDSEFSNHELLRSQNNGGNAIYAGISTSQIRFPYQSILNYIAHKKTLDACDNEWVMLHKTVENDIKEKERQEKESGRSLSMEDGTYARMVLEALAKLEDNEADDLIRIIDRGTAVYEKDGKKSAKSGAKIYYDKLKEVVYSKVPDIEEAKLKIDESFNSDNEGKPSKDAAGEKAPELKNILVNYYKSCVDAVKSVSVTTADAIITLDKKKQDIENKNLSLTINLLKKKDKFIHPVAAMVQLCRLRKLIADEFPEKTRVEEWKDLRSRNITSVPKDMLTLSEEEENITSAEGNASLKVSSSKYFKEGAERFINLSSESLDLAKERTSPKADLQVLHTDVITILSNIQFAAQEQMIARVITRISHDIDVLISKYRAFFNRFGKEKEDLVEATKTALRCDAEDVDSVINVYSSINAKNEILKQIDDESGPATDAELAETDDVVGQSVFKTAFGSAVAASSNDNNFNDKDASAFRSLFGNMINGYKGFVEKSEAFAKVASYNVIEAIVESAVNASEKERDAKFSEAFSRAQEFAKPSLRIDERGDLEDLVQPSEITVFMMSVNTGRYLKKHAEDFGLRLPADQTKEINVIKSCAEEFIRRFSGNSAARVAIVEMPDYTIYCTGEIMDITPLRISKFDELGQDNTYFRNYSLAISNIKKRNTDMWNPHIGNDLHKRGYLPYMNEEKERQCDNQVVKALIYALGRQKIVYTDGIVAMRGHYYFTYNNEKIVGPDGKWINSKNIAQLVAWLRNEDELVADWSSLFERDLQSQQNALPSLASDNPNEISKLEASLTASPLMKLFTNALYTDKQFAGKNEKRVGPTIIEFAYLVKTSEESACDCDDAERILTVAYEIFKEMVSYRALPENNPERFMQVYRQQLDKIYEALAWSKIVVGAGEDCAAHFSQLVNWLNYAGTFKTISNDTPMDETGKICINVNYEYNSSDTKNNVKSILEKIKANKGADLYGEEEVEEAQQ